MRPLPTARLLLLIAALSSKAGEMGNELPHYPTCAVLDFRPGQGINAGEALTFSERLTVELSPLGVFRMIDPRRMRELLALKEYARSDLCDAAECAAASGKALNVQYAIFGSLERAESLILCSAYLVRVSDTGLVRTGKIDYRGPFPGLFEKELPLLAAQLAGFRPDRSQPTTPASPDGSHARPSIQHDAFVERRTGTRMIWLPLTGVWMAEREVSNRDLRLFEQAHDSASIAGLSLNQEDQPAVHLPQQKAVDFCNWLNQSTVEAPRRFRLPRRAEWGEALGASPVKVSGSDTPRFGNLADRSLRERLSGFGGLPHYDDGYIITAPVRSYAPNPAGFYDLIGNVREWCEDVNEHGYAFAAGSSWRSMSPESLQTGYGHWYPPSAANDEIGFRLACEAIQQELTNSASASLLEVDQVSGERDGLLRPE